MNTEPTKMRLWKKVLIGLGITLFVLGVIIAIILIWKVTWILFFIIGGIALFIWVIISTVLIYQKLTKKEPVTIKANLEDLKELIIFKMKTDRDNPDNFMILQQIPIKIGERGGEKTIIWKFVGKGVETNQNRVALINGKNTNEIAILIEPTEKEIIETAVGMAEDKPDVITREIIPAGVDDFGMPTPARVKMTSMSRAEAKEEKEKEEAEVKTAF
ncbi:MAG: hypothetical protein AAB706_00525 [Patescibacteria group bacterium]